MQLQELNSGLIYTNSNCIGCNKCISGCVAIGANVVVRDERVGNYKVKVDPNRCILCGHCTKECVHDARTYRDDTDAFFEDLKRGEKISVLIAPALLTNYESQYNNILGYLKHMGVNHMYNVSFGADVMVWVYMNLIHSFGLQGVISQSCPVIVNYLEKYKPELLDNLMPVQSPMMCTAIYVSDYLGVTDKLAFISPCIAKKQEIDDVNAYGKVSYNVTFDRLMEHIGDMDISGFSADDEVDYGLGALVPRAGGLSENIKLYIGFQQVLIQTSGYQNIFPYFEHYYKDVINGEELPFLVDMMNCTNGCCFGTATSCGMELSNKMTFSAHRSKEKAYRSGNVPKALNYESRIGMLNKRFEDFAISSFVRQYGRTRKIDEVLLNDNTIETIYSSMYKDTYEKRHTDCGACGYKTCKDMVHAIGTNINHKENCINYSKECIRIETEKTNVLLSEISVMNEELRKSTQMKSNFLANMSHEIRTPMNAVIGMAEMALRGNLSNEEKGYIQQIKASGRSLLAIINDILDFSKIESGKMELNESEYTVMSIINDTVNIVMTRIGEKDITLLIDADPDIPYQLYGDDIRIKQVLVNFANNAVKFTESGSVKITMRFEYVGQEGSLVVSISDTGIGIKEEDMEKLFTSFQQVDSKRNRNIEGTGLGLVISREFVRLMGGGISVESTYGVGSTFSFRIPQRIVSSIPSVSLKEFRLYRTASYIDNHYVSEGYSQAISAFNIENRECDCVEDVRESIESGVEFVFINYPLWNEDLELMFEKTESTKAILIIDPRKDIVTSHNIGKMNQPVYSLGVALAINHNGMKTFESDASALNIKFEAPEAQVLIVDDNAINLTVATGLLSPFRMSITVASSGREAVELVTKNKYDIVFMDHMMPDMDGVEATQIIRGMEDEYFKNLPIIALTANAINNAREMFLSNGMNDFVAKPIDMLDITSKLRKWLPDEKIKNVGSEAEALADNMFKEVPDSLVIEGIDVSAGMAFAGTMELYRKILTDYHAVIEKKAELIERYEAEDNLGSYTIEVHALKSASKLIGATQLSEQAARLEACGHQGDIGPIKKETAELLKLYRSYIPILEPYINVAEAEGEEEIDTEGLNVRLSNLCEALDDFDIDTAGEIMTELNSFKFSGRAAELRSSLKEAVEEMEYDDAIELAREWQTL